MKEARFVRRWRKLRSLLAETGVSGIAWEMFKRRRGLDLAYVSTTTLGFGEGQGHHYSDSGGPQLHRVLSALAITPDDAILDVGCGKGGALITMSRFRFGRIAGVDLSAELLDVARANLDRLGLRSVALYQGDAAQFADLDAYNYFYLYNPFPEPVVSRWLMQLRQSLGRRERTAVIIYKNPVGDACVRQAFPEARVRTWQFRGGDHHRIWVYTVPGVATQDSTGSRR